jgi:hypothetical protein
LYRASKEDGGHGAKARLCLPYWLAIAAALSLMEIHDMSTHAIGFESSLTGVAPDGWTRHADRLGANRDGPSKAMTARHRKPR